MADSLRLIWAARRGLSEAELMNLLGQDGQPLPRQFWTPFYLVAERSLAMRAGLLNFGHDYLRAANPYRVRRAKAHPLANDRVFRED